MSIFKRALTLGKGTAASAVAAVTSGVVELGGIVGIVSFPPINKNYNVAAYPGLFSSYEQQRAFFLES